MLIKNKKKSILSGYYTYVAKVVTAIPKWIYVLRNCISIRFKLAKSTLIVLSLKYWIWKKILYLSKV